MTVSIRNYDGTEKHQMLRQEEGFEVVTEMLLSQDGKLLAKSCRRGLIYLITRKILSKCCR
jgi:hypothetical protein